MTLVISVLNIAVDDTSSHPSRPAVVSSAWSDARSLISMTRYSHVVRIRVSSWARSWMSRSSADPAPSTVAGALAFDPLNRPEIQPGRGGEFFLRSGPSLSRLGDDVDIDFHEHLHE